MMYMLHKSDYKAQGYGGCDESIDYEKNVQLGMEPAGWTHQVMSLCVR